MKKLCTLLWLFATLAASAQQTFLLKPAVLSANKQKLKTGDPAMLEALAKLKRAADKALKDGPYSVTYKSRTPDSGDKHDYMSVGPYWWPDSSKPGGVPYIRKDGQVNPERFAINDAEFYKSLCHDVCLLGLAWYYTGDEQYATHATKLLRTWYIDTATLMNPNLNYGQSIPGVTKGRGIGLIDTRAVTKLIDGIQLLSNSKALSKKDYKAIQDWHKKFLDWMRNNPIGKDEADEANNHGTWYDVQTISIALFTEQPALAKEMITSQTQLRISSQLKEEGSQPHELARTLSWNYSSMNLEGFFELAMLAENVQIDLWNYTTTDNKSIRKAFTWMLPFAKGEQKWQHQQIKKMEMNGYLKMATVAAKKYPEVDLKGLNIPQDDIILLTGWNF